ncbi:MAG TPA: sugar ABC transporter substrate-binding protein [Trebonia sp.]|jgi:multiple sugar transport system substrate-binding protein|nr:sugar ABC transporter substrate-binding protein [Trebonia sp.]
MHENPRKRTRARGWRTAGATASAAAAGLAVVTGLAACSSSSSSASPAASTTSSASSSAAASAAASASSTPAAAGTGSSAIAAALQQPTTLTVWAWAPQTAAIVKAFEKQYPKVTINLVNAGTGSAEYTKLENAIKAGSGAPDVAQIEYYALPQFALQGALADLSADGLGSVKSQFSSAVWGSVNVGGKLVGLPQDTGPMALFYNKTIFDKYHLAVPTTWAQYAADAATLHAADPKEYIGNDTGDPGFVTSMIWAAGGDPYAVSGTKNVTINLQDAGAKKFASLWSPLITKGLLAPVTSWSTQWYTGLANGSIASLVTGGWMGVDLETGVPSGKGDWRVAPLPEWTAGTPATSENGGSADSVLASSKNQLAAAGFLQYMNTGPGEQISATSGDFPSSNAMLNAASFLDQAPAYFGGQKINQVLSKAASQVLPGWSYLPFQVYANSIFPNTVGQAYTGKSSLDAGLQAWQQQSASYGSQQGFSVSG